MRQRVNSADCQKLGQEEGSPSKKASKRYAFSTVRQCLEGEYSLGLRGQDLEPLAFPFAPCLPLLWMPGVDMDVSKLD